MLSHVIPLFSIDNSQNSVKLHLQVSSLNFTLCQATNLNEWRHFQGIAYLYLVEAILAKLWKVSEKFHKTSR